MPDQPILIDYETALLFATADDFSRMETVMESSMRRLADAGLVVAESGAVGAGYVLTDTGKAAIASVLRSPSSVL